MNERGTHSATILPQGISKVLLKMRIGVRSAVHCWMPQLSVAGADNPGANFAKWQDCPEFLVKDAAMNAKTIFHDLLPLLYFFRAIVVVLSITWHFLSKRKTESYTMLDARLGQIRITLDITLTQDKRAEAVRSVLHTLAKNDRQSVWRKGLIKLEILPAAQ